MSVKGLGETEPAGGCRPAEAYRRKTPLLAKLGIFTFVSVSLGGTIGFLATTLTKESAKFLSIALSGAASAALLGGWTLRRNGVVNMLPNELEIPLYEWDLIDTVRYVQSSLDFDAAQKTMKELAPLTVAKTKEEIDQVVGNMSGYWQRILTTKGLLGLLPPDVQEMLLPKGAPMIPPPATIQLQRPADLDRQVVLFQELAMRRLIEFRDDLATRSRVVRGMKMIGEVLGKLHGFIKENTSSDLQVTVIMSVIGLLVLRVSIIFTLFLIRKSFSILYL